jgi:anhydro-N-acetylmuramic acid kinase
MLKKQDYHVLGIMSGTSLDGIDLVEIYFDFSEKWSYRIGASETVSYSSVWKQELQRAISFSEVKLNRLNEDYTDYLSEVISAFIEKHHLANIDAVCSHGHTILHQPDRGITLQIGNLPKLATRIHQKVVCDFRLQDVALGGQGAPLVPIGDRLLFADYDYCLNLGGFANCSFEQEGKRIAYDICPVNIVLNFYAEALGFPYDDKGSLAASGKVDQMLLKQLNALKYYLESPPKSLGLEWVKEMIFPTINRFELSSEDMLATFTEHIAAQIAKQFQDDSSVLVTGGGTYNYYLLKRIRFYGNVELVIPSEEIIEYKEALVFGLLGVLKLRGEVNCLASVTGSAKDHSSGNIFFP